MPKLRDSAMEMSVLKVYCPNVIDIEASGFGPNSYPIEIGVVKADGQRFCGLIKPVPLWQHWSKEAEQLHGISRELLITKGLAPATMCRSLNDFLGRETVYSDAWVHDQKWLHTLYHEAAIVPSFSMRAIEFIANETQLARWDDAKHTVIADLQLARHRASGDAFVVQQTYIRVAATA